MKTDLTCLSSIWDRTDGTHNLEVIISNPPDGISIRDEGNKCHANWN